MSKETVLALIGMAAMVVHTFVLYRAWVYQDKLCILLVCFIMASLFVDYRHGQDTIMRGFINGLYSKDKPHD